VELADLVSRVRKTGLTFAPEAGSDRLRGVINKNVTTEDILASAEAAFARGLAASEALFHDRPADRDARRHSVHRRFAGAPAWPGPELRAREKHNCQRRRLCPKAHTPFQWEPFAERSVLREKLAFLRERTRERATELKWHNVDLSFVEAVLSRGDRRLAPVIHRVWEQGGRFDGWGEFFSIERWEDALRDTGIDPAAYTGARDPAVPLPWSHIDLGVTADWLLRERARSLAAETTPDCRAGGCHQCGLGGPRERVLAPELDCDTWSRLAEQLALATAEREAARTAAGHAVAPAAELASEPAVSR